METSFEKISKLLCGYWEGEGFASYPTIRDASYFEEFTVSEFEDTPVLRFEQKAWYINQQKEKQKVVFWETGFWVFKDETISILSSQFSGRFELLKLDRETVEEGEYTFGFKSDEIVNDPRVRSSERQYQLSKGILSYQLNMELENHPQSETHLKAKLAKR